MTDHLGLTKNFLLQPVASRGRNGGTHPSTKGALLILLSPVGVFHLGQLAAGGGVDRLVVESASGVRVEDGSDLVFPYGTGHVVNLSDGLMSSVADRAFSEAAGGLIGAQAGVRVDLLSGVHSRSIDGSEVGTRDERGTDDSRCVHEVSADRTRARFW